MVLPHYPSSANIEPIYSSLFEITFITSSLTKEEIQFLKRNNNYIKKNNIGFNVNSDNKVSKLLLKIDIFDLVVKCHKKNGEVHTIFEYLGCKFKNLKENLVNFSYISNDVLTYQLEFDYKDIEIYFSDSQYSRIKKFDNILN